MKRKIIVRSNPEGALVTIDRQPIGHTPVAIPVTYYGTREIQIEKDGFETKKIKHRFRAPWFQYPPFDLITDNFWPYEINDDRVIDFQLTAQSTVDESYLIDRANQLRGNVYRDTVTAPLVSERSDANIIDSPPPPQTAVLPRGILRR